MLPVRGRYETATLISGLRRARFIVPRLWRAARAALFCSLDVGPRIVRGLAAHLRVSKPAISRALDRLEEFLFMRRVADPADRRGVNVGRTRAGAAYVDRLHEMMAGAAEAV